MVFFYTFDVTEQKTQEQILKKITDLGFEFIADIDIRRDTYQLISFDEDAYGILPKSGHFQKEVREIAESTMEGAACESYLKLSLIHIFRKRMDAGKGDDVFMVNHDIVLELEEEGKLAELSELDIITDYTDTMLSQMEDQGDIYWVPTTVSAFGLYCNQTLLRLSLIHI